MTRKLAVGAALLVVAALAIAIARFLAHDPDVLSGGERADFVRSATEACVARQKANPDNATVDQKVIDAYCGCYADGLAKRISKQDLARLSSAAAADIQTTMKSQMEDAERVCLAKLDKD